jgi:DNA repair protein RAD50
LKTSSTLANLKPLEEQLQSLQHEQSQLESTISALKEDLEKKRNIINTQTEHRRNMEDNLHLRKLHLDMSEKKETTQKLANQLSCYNKSGMLESKKELVVQMDRLKEERSVLKGRQHELEKQREDVDRELHSDIYTSALRTYKEKLFSFKTTLVASSDLDKFYKALDAYVVILC